MVEQEGLLPLIEKTEVPEMISEILAEQSERLTRLSAISIVCLIVLVLLIVLSVKFFLRASRTREEVNQKMAELTEELEKTRRELIEGKRGQNKNEG